MVQEGVKVALLVVTYFSIALVFQGLLWNAHATPLTKRGKIWYRVMVPLFWPIGVLWIAWRCLLALCVLSGIIIK